MQVHASHGNTYWKISAEPLRSETIALYRARHELFYKVVPTTTGYRNYARGYVAKDEILKDFSLNESTIVQIR